MEKREIFYSIMTVRLKKREAQELYETISKSHFLPKSRFELLCEHGFYHVVCKIYEHELPLFGFKKLCDRRKTLERQTLKVKRWLRKTKRRSL